MRALLFAVAPLLAAAPAAAERWEIVVNPYFMVPTSDGRFGVGALEVGIDSSPADLFRRLNWGVMGAVEVNNGSWGFALDVNYLNIDVTDDGLRRLSVNGHQAAYTATVLMRIDQRAEIYAGLRVTDFGLSLSCNTVCPQPLDERFALEQQSRNRSWMEPLVGLRVRHEFAERFDVMVMADVGGFAIGSDFSANVWPQLGYRIGNSMTAQLGYRLIYVQYDEGEGRERFLFDAVTHGPTVGLELRF